MAKKNEPKAEGCTIDSEILRQPAEVKYADQLEAMQQNDADTPPSGWLLIATIGVALHYGWQNLEGEN